MCCHSKQASTWHSIYVQHFSIQRAMTVTLCYCDVFHIMRDPHTYICVYMYIYLYLPIYIYTHILYLSTYLCVCVTFDHTAEQWWWINLKILLNTSMNKHQTIFSENTLFGTMQYFTHVIIYKMDRKKKKNYHHHITSQNIKPSSSETIVNIICFWKSFIVRGI